MSFKSVTERKYRISISIVAYDNYEDIFTALESLASYVPKTLNKVIYIIDNTDCCNAFDNSVLLDRLRKYPDTIYLKSDRNIGFGAGHNMVLDNLDSEYHCIMNPDISFYEDCLSPIISFMDSHKDIGMVIPNIVGVDGKRQLAYRKNPTVFDLFIRFFCKNLFAKRYLDHTLSDMDYSNPFHVPFGHGAFLVIRTDLFKELKGFDENFFLYLEDADLCRRVNLKSKLFYFPGSTVIHRWERGSHKNIKLFFCHLRSVIYYFNKWGWKWM